MKYLTQKEAAEILRLSVVSVARLRKHGFLPYVPGRPVLLPLDGLLNYIKQKEIPAWKFDLKTQGSNKTGGLDIMKSGGPNTTNRQAVLERERIRAAQRTSTWLMLSGKRGI